MPSENMQGSGEHSRATVGKRSACLSMPQILWFPGQLWAAGIAAKQVAVLTSQYLPPTVDQYNEVDVLDR
jgi:hypothetical protein